MNSYLNNWWLNYKPLDYRWQHLRHHSVHKVFKLNLQEEGMISAAIYCKALKVCPMLYSVCIDKSLQFLFLSLSWENELLCFKLSLISLFNLNCLYYFLLARVSSLDHIFFFFSCFCIYIFLHLSYYCCPPNVSAFLEIYVYMQYVFIYYFFMVVFYMLCLVM